MNAYLEISHEIHFDQIIDRHVEKNLPNEGFRCLNDKISRINRKTKMYMNYKLVNNIYLSLRRNRVMSVVQCYDENYYAIIQTQPQNLRAIVVLFEHHEYIDSLAIHHHEVKFGLSLTEFDPMNVEESFISKYLLLIPELGKERYINEQKYSSY